MSSDALKTLTAGPPLPRWAVLGTMALATAVRAGVLLTTPDVLVADPDGYRAMAENVVRHGTLGHGDVPTAFRAPLYPLILTPCVALGPWCRAAIGVVHLAMGLATVWLTWAIGRRCGLRWGAVAAALLVACDPILLRQSTLVMTETLATLLAAAGLLALAALSEKPIPTRAAVAGGAVALGSLCRPELLLCGAGAAVGLAWVVQRDRAGLKACGAFLAAGLLIHAPWAARNWRQFGWPVLTTTHGGYTLALGNNAYYYEHLRQEGWTPVCGPTPAWEPADFHAYWARFQWSSPGTALRDEVGNDAVAYQLAFKAIEEDPATFVHASMVRLRTFWQLTPGRLPGVGRHREAVRWAIGAWYASEFLLAAIGLWAVFRRRWGSASLRHTLAWGALLAAVLTAVHALYWTDMRMRAPLMPVAALAAAAGAACLAARADRHKSIVGNRL